MTSFSMYNRPHVIGKVHGSNDLLSSTPLTHLDDSEKLPNPAYVPLMKVSAQQQDLISSLNMDNRPSPTGKVKKMPHVTRIPYCRSESNLKYIHHPEENNTLSNILEQTLLTADQKFPYKCPYCGRCFAKRVYLSTHKNLHKSIKQIRSDLFHHNEEKNAPSNILEQTSVSADQTVPYKCPYCGRGYANNSLLSTHMHNHTAKYNFRCSQCPNSYRYKQQLLNHQISHCDRRL